MFSKVAVVAILATAVVAQTSTTNKCNVGELQCCKSVQKADSKAAQTQLGIAGVALGAVQGLVGITCSPLSVVGIGAGANCNATPVCCENNKFNGVVALGCTPINLNL